VIYQSYHEIVQVYVGAINRLHQLSSDLELKAEDVTGPKMDNPECALLDCPNDIQKKPTENVNKVLLIDYSTSRLIECGTLFQGLCNVRSLQNITILEKEVQEAVVANEEHASTVAFIAPGPTNPPSSHVMYVGVTYTNNSPDRSKIPAVASRSLQKEKMFQIAASHEVSGTRMFINNYARETYPIKYVYGFSSERFSYFLSYQPKNSHQSQSRDYISKLVRICQDDSSYYSYTEIPIECVGKDGTKYNSVQAGYVGKPGSDLAESLNIQPNVSS